MQSPLQQLRRIQRLRGWGLLALADRLDMSPASLSRKLRGLQPVTLDELETLAKALKFSIKLTARRQ